MKNILFSTILVFAGFTVKSQSVRYFEFRQPYETSFTSFIVATSDQDVINTVLNDLAIPIAYRRFISGNVTNGSGGFNHDGTNWQTWHFVPNEWQLTSANVEFCDGISSAIGTNPIVIAGDTLYFCPWTSYPYQEIVNPELSINDLNADITITIYPNPATDKVFVEWIGSDNLSIELYDMASKQILTLNLTKQQNEIDVSYLTEGIYFIAISDGNKREVKKILINH